MSRIKPPAPAGGVIGMTDENMNNIVSPKSSIPWYLNRNVFFLLFNAIFAAAFSESLRDIIQTSWNSEYDTFIPFIPFISAYLMYQNKHNIFNIQRSSFCGLFIISSGIALMIIGRNRGPFLDHRDYLTIVTFAIVTIWIGGFALFYGVRSVRIAAFPLLFLLLAVPIPGAILERIILFLQTGSAEAAYGLLRAAGIPVARDGFVFHLLTIDVEVAPQCSGIRSFLSLVITGLLAGYFFLCTIWARTIFVLTLLPIAIIKNGIRICVLSVLGVYWDQSILASDIHRKGGVVFFLIALLFAGMIVMLLKKLEKNLSRKAPVKGTEMREVA